MKRKNKPVVIDIPVREIPRNTELLSLLMDEFSKIEKRIASDETRADSTIENITDSFWWLSLKFLDKHPEVFEQMTQHPSNIPAERLAEILAAAAKKLIPNSCVLRGVSIRLKPNLYEFQISGSISEDEFEKLSGLREAWFHLEDENQSDK